MSSDIAIRCGLVPDDATPPLMGFVGDSVPRLQDAAVPASPVPSTCGVTHDDLREYYSGAAVEAAGREGPLSDVVASTIQERGKIYGEPHLSHENIGLAWTGIIQQHFGIRLPGPIPAFLVELMMVQFKLQRSARVFHGDNYVDARAYLNFAEHGQEKPGQPYPK